MLSSYEFLSKYKLRADDVDIQQLVDSFTSEMIKGLLGAASSLRMIPTYIAAENSFLTEVPVLAIDAGGTNFRAAKVKFSKEGMLEMTQLVNTEMPGIAAEISKQDFFQTIAGYVKPIAEEADRIGFCFSYPSEILPNKDGRLIQFCKEVKAPGVVGELIGENLLETLQMPHKKIVLLNDTVATLLSGKSASKGINFDSYIGLILGTGTNTCYIEKNSDILKSHSLDPSKSQIINVESGNFGKAPQTELDKRFDNTTNNPGSYTFEKMVSGGYLGGFCLLVLQTAGNETLFSTAASDRLKKLSRLTTEDLDSFFRINSLERGPLSQCMLTEEDEENCGEIIESVIERAGKMIAANVASIVLKTNKGTNAEHPILITIEGTTFYSLYKLKHFFVLYFSEYLSGDRQRFVQFTSVPQSSLVGAALAALID